MNAPSAHAIRVLARMMEENWLPRHLGWRITAPSNDNRAPWSPVPAA